MSSGETYPKRLIEVDLPIKRISAHARREKSIRHGHISTLHIWWARRPLAACRAVICAALWPDPADAICPKKFKDEAKGRMLDWANNHADKGSAESFARLVSIQKAPQKLDDAIELRRALLDFIADFANWDNSTVPEYLETSRALSQAAHEALGGAPGTRPLVVDPFAGGGSIPLEALRVGADAFSSDLNPLPVLLNKVILEFIPKHGQRLADQVRQWGESIGREAKEELSAFYPKGPNGATPIAYLWARTIQCEGPGCGAVVPLMRSLWLAKKGRSSVALRIVPNQKNSSVSFEIVQDAKSKDVEPGTIRRGSVTCPCCGFSTPVESVRTQLKSRRGGTKDARLIAVRFDEPKNGERSWRLANTTDESAASAAADLLEQHKRRNKQGLSLVPDELLPPEGTLGFRVQKYGMLAWGDLFSPRQALALTVLGRLVREANINCEPELALATRTCLALAVNRLADFNASLCVLNSVGGRGVVHVFGRQALPMVWDFMETNPFNTEAANWQTCFEVVDEVIALEKWQLNGGHVEKADATKHPLPDDSVAAFITDPPYYDAVPYADLSDFFYVWLRRNLPTEYPDLLGESVTSKDGECIVDVVRGKDRHYFEVKIAQAMVEGRRLLQASGVAMVVFAHKSTAGWEALLQAMIDAGWVMTASWPIDTERPGRLRAQNSAALASSVHLVCRPRENRDGSVLTHEVGGWRDVLEELPRRIHEWMPRLAEEGVVGADAIFACLGPALEIFSRYSRVEKASGEAVTLKEYLEQVWAAVAREALSTVLQDNDSGSLEPDARLSVIWLWTLGGGETVSLDDETESDDEEDDDSGAKTTSGYVLEFDAARKIAQGLGANLDALEHVVAVNGDKARLLAVAERTQYLFGKPENLPTAKPAPRKKQLALFEEIEKVAAEQGWGDVGAPKGGTTSLDRVHQAMLLFASGRGEALKRFLVEEGVGKRAAFWRLSQALSALYPTGSEERRWVEGVLARKKGLGF